MRELYVYYRVRAASLAAAREAVQTMQHRLCDEQPDLVARLLIRASTGDEPQTWMETYSLPGDAQGIGPDLEALIASQAASWAQLVDGTRHVEAFTSI